MTPRARFLPPSKRRIRTQIASLVGTDGQVAIYSSEKYMYSVNDADFTQMLADCALDADTALFQITSVKVDGNNAIVKCKHQFVDGDGAMQTVYQQYHLTDAGAQFQVVGFSTSEKSM